MNQASAFSGLYRLCSSASNRFQEPPVEYKVHIGAIGEALGYGSRFQNVIFLGDPQACRKSCAAIN